MNNKEKKKKKIQIEYLWNNNGIFHLAVAEHTAEIVSPMNSILRITFDLDQICPTQ